MATQVFCRTLLSRPAMTTKALINSLLSRSFSSLPTPSSSSRSFCILRTLRPLSASGSFVANSLPAVTIRSLSTRATSSSLNDPSPNWSNRPPKETILLDGCDFEHWLVVMEKPEGDPTRDEIIDSYIKTLAMVVGSEEEARMKIYSVSTRCYYAFGALVSEELSYKIKELPRVRWVLPDSYLDVKNKDYGGEPFIDGKAVPYDPKYHEEWIRNNARANERNRRNDRPRNFDRSRNFERRRENMQNRDFQNMQTAPVPNQAMQNSVPNPGGMQQNMSGPPPPPPPPPATNNYTGAPQNNFGPPGGFRPAPPNYMAGPQNNMGGPRGSPQQPLNNYPGGPQNNFGGSGGPPPNSYPGGPQNNFGGPGGPPPNSYPGGPQNPNSYMGRPQNMGGGPGGPPPNSYSGGPQNVGGMPSPGGWSNNVPGNMQQNFQNDPNNGPMPPNFQNNSASDRDTSMPGGNP